MREKGGKRGRMGGRERGKRGGGGGGRRREDGRADGWTDILVWNIFLSVSMPIPPPTSPFCNSSIPFVPLYCLPFPPSLSPSSSSLPLFFLPSLISPPPSLGSEGASRSCPDCTLYCPDWFLPSLRLRLSVHGDHTERLSGSYAPPLPHHWPPPLLLCRQVCEQLEAGNWVKGQECA